MWDLSSLTRDDRTHIPCIGEGILTTGLPGKSLPSGFWKGLISGLQSSAFKFKWLTVLLTAKTSFALPKSHKSNVECVVSCPDSNSHRLKPARFDNTWIFCRYWWPSKYSRFSLVKDGCAEIPPQIINRLWRFKMSFKLVIQHILYHNSCLGYYYQISLICSACSSLAPRTLLH